MVIIVSSFLSSSYQYAADLKIAVVLYKTYNSTILQQTSDFHAIGSENVLFSNNFCPSVLPSVFSQLNIY